MSTTWPTDFCPYKGLQPYTEQDRAFFFGRDRDQRIIISNLFAAPLTVFYGASGVGKSSVLLAGAVPRLKQERNLTVVVLRNWQDPGFLSQLKQKTLEAVSQTAKKELQIDLTLPLDDFLAELSQTARGSVFLVFDQFEEYFLYNPPGPNSGTFEAEFARVINRRDVSAHFLLSMREDGLSKLDRFQGRIPTLLNNMLRLEHLNRDAAKVAITQPIEEYNRLADGRPTMAIEPKLVTAILNDLQGAYAGAEQLGQGVGRSSAEGSSAPIETPFLQMVMTRLWNEERAAGSTTMRMQTFETLGRAENIARTHLDNTMGRLSDSERDDAARVLRYMVTPSRTKIAQEAGALASWAELPEAQVKAILTRLTGPDMRILRPVQTPGRPDQHEIFHDVLAGAILDWRARYVQERKLREAERQMAIERAKTAEQLARQRKRTKRLWLMSAGLLVVTVVMIYLIVRAYRAESLVRFNTLMTYSEISLKTDPEVALLLAVEAVKTRETPSSVAALQQALLESMSQATLGTRKKNSRIADVAFSPDGKYVVTASWDSTAHVWEALTGKSVSVLVGHQGQVNTASFSPDESRYVVTAGQDKTARVWEEWRTATPRLVKTLSESGEIFTADFSPDGNYILTAGAEGVVRVWEWKHDPAPTKELTVALALASSAPVPEPTAILPKDTGSNPGLAASSAPSPSSVATPTPSSVTSPAPNKILVFKAEFSPDGKSIIIAARNKQALIWRWSEGTKNVKLIGHRFAVYDAAFSHDSKYAVTGSDDATAIVWELGTANASLVSVPLGTNRVRGVAFSPDSKFIATASYDGLARLWDWRELRKDPTRYGPIVLRGQAGLLMCVAFAPSGSFAVTGSDDGTARVWRTQKLEEEEIKKLTPNELLKLARERVTRELTPEERAKYVDVVK